MLIVNVQGISPVCIPAVYVMGSRSSGSPQTMRYPFMCCDGNSQQVSRRPERVHRLHAKCVAMVMR